MPDCSRIKACPFFRDQLARMPKTSETLKNIYCRNHYSSCARYLVSMKGLPTPSNLFPNEDERAARLIAEVVPARSVQY
jgi:hypothetical protein